MHRIPTFLLLLVLVSGLANTQVHASAATSGAEAESQSQDASKPTRLSASEIHRLEVKAEAGDATAQSTLGKAYQDGNGVSQDDALALKWLRKAAGQGDAAAENSLGVIYRMGSGVRRDNEEAVRWYLKAAKQGNAKAMFNLGAAYYNNDVAGDGVTANDVVSFAWFLLAQEAGDAAADEPLRRATSESGVGPSEAYVKVAKMYEAGDELPKNPPEELKWYRKAADAGGIEASIRVASLLLTTRNPTPDEYAEIRRRCEYASKMNFSQGDYCMALIYDRALGVDKDPVESKKWLARAADRGHMKAGLELGEAYWKGEGVKADVVKAYTWVWLAYNSKEPGAEQVEQELRKELAEKQMNEAKKKAIEWANTHRLFGLIKRLNASTSPPQ